MTCFGAERVNKWNVSWKQLINRKYWSLIVIFSDRTTFTLQFTAVKLEDDSAVERYECWAHKPGDNTDQWVSSAKHGFAVQVIKGKCARYTVILYLQSITQ